MTRSKASLGLVLAGVLVGIYSWVRRRRPPPATMTPPRNSQHSPLPTILPRNSKSSVPDLQKAVADEEEYKSQVEGRFTRDGDTITLIAIALGLHDQDSPLKPNAKAIAAAARTLAKAKGFAATKQAVADIKVAVDGQGTGTAELKWGKVATLKGLMKDEVPPINNKLKNGLRRFKKRAGEIAANAATMALIAENANLYVADTKHPAEGKQWTEFATQTRAAAVDLAAEAHAGDEPGAKAAMDKLTQSCHDCHKVFNPEKDIE